MNHRRRMDHRRRICRKVCAPKYIWIGVTLNWNCFDMTTPNWQKYPSKPLAYRCKFDFDVGYLVCSPCRACDQIRQLPACSQTCSQLENVRHLLADVISCARRR